MNTNNMSGKDILLTSFADKVITICNKKIISGADKKELIRQANDAKAMLSYTGFFQPGTSVFVRDEDCKGKWDEWICKGVVQYIKADGDFLVRLWNTHMVVVPIEDLRWRFIGDEELAPAE